MSNDRHVHFLILLHSSVKIMFEFDCLDLFMTHMCRIIRALFFFFWFFCLFSFAKKIELITAQCILLPLLIRRGSIL